MRMLIRHVSGNLERWSEANFILLIWSGYLIQEEPHRFGDKIAAIRVDQRRYQCLGVWMRSGESLKVFFQMVGLNIADADLLKSSAENASDIRVLAARVGDIGG